MFPFVRNMHSDGLAHWNSKSLVGTKDASLFVVGLTGWELIRLLIFLESGRFWLWDTCNPSNTSIPMWLVPQFRYGKKLILNFPSIFLGHLALNLEEVQNTPWREEWRLRNTIAKISFAISLSLSLVVTVAKRVLRSPSVPLHSGRHVFELSLQIHFFHFNLPLSVHGPQNWPVKSM